MDTEQARVTRQFSVSPQVVFNAWVDPKAVAKWLFATAGQIIEIDACAGGWFYIVGRRNGKIVEYLGEYLEVVRPYRLVFALFAEKYSLNFERVTVVINPRGIGCELSLTHDTKPEFAQQVRCDWIKVLDRLAAMLGQTGSNAVPEEIAG